MVSNGYAVEVSVICNTYNHIRYIRDALEGFVTQRTSFPFEVLIHDDASTDGTADVIREYEARYPGLILPICQTQNQHSQGVKISSFQHPRVRGKYVAFCEGDDYWTDPEKLQKQYDLMEKHPEVDICAHASRVINAETGETDHIVSPADACCVIPAERVIRGGGGFVSTNTIFYRAELLKDIPPFRRMMGTDFSMQVHGALRGGMLFIPEVMSVYRKNTNGSWIAAMKKDRRKRIEHKKLSIRAYRQMDKDTGKKYHRILRKMILRQQAKILALRLGIE